MLFLEYVQNNHININVKNYGHVIRGSSRTTMTSHRFCSLSVYLHKDNQARVIQENKVLLNYYVQNQYLGANTGIFTSALFLQFIKPFDQLYYSRGIIVDDVVFIT
jgi:hypothetical protein